MAKIILDGIVEGINTRTDGSIKIIFGTQEINSASAAQLFELRGKYVKCLISDSNISKVEEEFMDKTELAQTGKQKSPSQRLRSVLYIAHSQSGFHIPFEDYYRTEMERMINVIKLKLY